MKNKQNKFVEASIIINAPIEEVWKELTDFENLQLWSSTFVGLKGTLAPNADIEVHFKLSMGGAVKKMRKQLFHFEEGKSFGWTGVFLLGMKDRHLYSLEAISKSQTKLTQTDSISGGASFLFKNILERQMKKDYDLFNQELKRTLENW